MSLNNRNYAIDFLRGIAIIAVLFHHFHLVYHLDNSALNQLFSINFIKSIAGNGNYGVTLFFVISGFLITSTTLERYGSLGNIDMVGFYIFRFARIMPCLVLALLMICLFNAAGISIFENKENSTSLFIAILSVLTFWHNMLMKSVGYFNYCLNIFWSLSVEEVFYLIFPLICFFFKKLRFIIPIWVVVIIAAPIYRGYNASNEIIAVYGYFSCFDAIALGCCSAIISKYIKLNTDLKNILQYCTGALIFSVYGFVGIMENIAWCFSIIALGTAILLICATQPSTLQVQVIPFYKKMICWFGKMSYELYLFHIILLALFKQYIKAEYIGGYEKLFLLILFLTLSAAISGMIAKLYSEPLNRNIRKMLFNFRQKIIFIKPSEKKVYVSS